MSTEAELQATLDSIGVTLTSEEGVISTLSTGLAGLKQQIADLTAQVAAGSPVSQEQLDALSTEATAIQDKTAAQLAELQALATPPA